MAPHNHPNLQIGAGIAAWLKPGLNIIGAPAGKGETLDMLALLTAAHLAISGSSSLLLYDAEIDLEELSQICHAPVPELAAYYTDPPKRSSTIYVADEWEIDWSATPDPEMEKGRELVSQFLRGRYRCQTVILLLDGERDPAEAADLAFLHSEAIAAGGRILAFSDQPAELSAREEEAVRDNPSITLSTAYREALPSGANIAAWIHDGESFIFCH